MYLADWALCQIHIDRDSPQLVTQCNIIKGQVKFFLLNYRVAFQDFQIQLKGTVTIGTEETQFIPEEHETSSSPFHYFFIKKYQPTRPEFCLQGKGRGPHEFKFKLQLDTQSYPSSFQSRYGKIQYKLVVISTSENTESIAAEKIINLKGHLNLHLIHHSILHRRVNAPLTVTRKRSSIFFIRHVLTAILALNQSGFLPGEILVFSLTCKNGVVRTMTASLVQKIVYFNTKHKANQNRTVTTILDHSELRCRNENQDDREIHWAGGLAIPEFLMPTFTTSKKSLEIVYSLQFVVETAEGQPKLQGETQIIIGTCRGTEIPQLSGTSIQPVDDDTVSYQFDTTSDEPAILPPAYSTLYLYSRCSSLETLPPTYEEAVDGIRNDFEDEQQDDSFRPRRNSNVM